MTEARFAAMGTSAHIVVNGGDEQLITTLVARVGELERRWSRFLPTSEISRLNAANGAPCVVSADTVGLVEAMIDGWWATAGRFNPTMVASIEALGYDRDFSVLEPAPRMPIERAAAALGTIVVSGPIVQLPVGLQLDPGGIGKGLAADLVADAARAAGAEGVLVNLGGDLRISGKAAGDDPAWIVGIEHPSERGRLIGRVRLAEGAVATTTTARRQWLLGDGTAAHHVLDPRTGRPTSSARQQATVICGTGASAEVWAKVALLDAEIPDDCIAVLVGGDGSIWVLGDDEGDFIDLSCDDHRGAAHP